jgi:hypothetical protein
MKERTINIYGRRSDIIGIAELVYGSSGTPLALICPPSTVRAILFDSGLFRPEEVERWHKSERVPYHTELTVWILDIARMEGLAYKADLIRGYYVQALPIRRDGEDHKEYKWARRGLILEENDDENAWLNGEID